MSRQPNVPEVFERMNRDLQKGVRDFGERGAGVEIITGTPKEPISKRFS